jgi:uncharacterized protein YjiS (DUF1127 family)
MTLNHTAGRRARHSRRAALPEPGRIVRAVAHFARRLSAAIARERAVARSVRELRTLDARILRDIGVEPYRIEEAARAMAETRERARRTPQDRPVFARIRQSPRAWRR